MSKDGSVGRFAGMRYRRHHIAMSLGKLKAVARYIGIWIVGFVIALLFVNLISQQFKNSVFIQQWVDKLGYYRGTGTYIHRSEGFARTDFGKFGISGIPDVQALQGKKVVLFGDSYTEAHQVDDNNKVAQQLTVLLKGRATAVGFGYSNQNVVDYIYQIPAVEKLIPGIVYYVIIIPSVYDLMPRQASEFTYAKYVDEPSLRLIPPEKTPVTLEGLRKLLNKSKLNSIWNIMLNLKRNVEELQEKFSASPPTQQHDVSENFIESFRFILKTLKDSTDIPIVFAYIPDVPFLEEGRAVYDDELAAEAETLSEVCEEHGYGFISLTSAFGDFYRRTRRFPRGFPNSHPYEGHLNEDGHRLLANAICQYLSSGL